MPLSLFVLHDSDDDEEKKEEVTISTIGTRGLSTPCVAILHSKDKDGDNGVDNGVMIMMMSRTSKMMMLTMILLQRLR